MVEKPNIYQLTADSSDYPESVKLAFGRRSPALFVQGNLDLLTYQGIGFCGSRHASEKGLETAADCARQAAASGYVVVSGNAAGIDSVAHHSALEVGGSTILVLPEGIKHFRIRRELRAVWDWSRALVVSSFEPTQPWKSYRAMERNDLIIALSRAVIVIEAGEKGGTLHAGMRTLEVGKPLFVAVYEHMNDNAPGNALLISKGADRLTRSRSTGRANLDRVRNAADHVQSKARDERQALLL